MRRLNKKIKNVFWPHAGNQFKPSLISAKGLVVVVVSAVVIGTSTNFIRTGEFKVLSYATDITVGGLLGGTNNERVAVGVSGLTLNSQLNTAAQNKANHMIANDYWAHVAPSGETPWDFIDATGYVYLKAGENLAYGFLTSSGTIDGWMGSPGHKANLLDSDFNEVGFGIANGASYQGGEYTVVVAMYAKGFVQAASSGSSSGASSAPAPVFIPQTLSEPNDPPQTPAESSSQNASEDQEIQVSRDPNNYPAIEVTSPVLNQTVTGRVVTNFEALIKGQAPLSMYLTVGLLLCVGAVYLLRHIRVVHQFIVVGEHTLEGHPLLEAAVIYALIWLLMTATFGVVV